MKIVSQSKNHLDQYILLPKKQSDYQTSYDCIMIELRHRKMIFIIKQIPVTYKIKPNANFQIQLTRAARKD